MLTELLKRITGKAEKGQKRSSKWRKTRKEFIKEFPVCEICGSTEKLEIHHKIPFHIAPDLELEKSNLITLCDKNNRGCHFIFGHLCSWQSFNPSIELDSKIWYYKIINRYKK